MCGICGCSHHGEHHHNDHHHHDHDHHHHQDHHNHDHAGPEGHGPEGRAPHDLVRIEQDILARNDAFAGANRDRLSAAGVFALNLVSSPGSGKTTLLVKTIEMLKAALPVAVIEGDQETAIDAERIRATGVPTV